MDGSTVLTASPAEIWAKATAAAKEAAMAQNAKLLAEGHRGFDCGFAWVVIRPARGQFVSWCRKASHGRTGHNGGWHIWYSQFSLNTQSISVHEAAARAFAKVLQQHGIEAHADSRLD